MNNLEIYYNISKSVLNTYNNSIKRNYQILKNGRISTNSRNKRRVQK